MVELLSEKKEHASEILDALNAVVKVIDSVVIILLWQCVCVSKRPIKHFKNLGVLKEENSTWVMPYWDSGSLHTKMA